MNTREIIKELQSDKSVKQIEKELLAIDIKKSKEKGKYFGECESCGLKTVLVEEVDLCGPCCWGEADTANGNW